MAKKEDKEEEAKTDAPEGEGGEEKKDGAEGGEEGGSKKKLILFIAVPIVLLIAVGAGLYFTGMLDGLLGKKIECAEDDHECQEKAAAAEAEGGHSEEAKKGGGHGEAGGGSAFIEIPTMIVNLNSPEGSPRYLRLSVQLELEDPADNASVQAVIPRVIDQFQTYLRELRVKDLRGSAGIYRLQMELLWRVNQAAAPAKVKDVLFQEILIQ